MDEESCVASELSDGSGSTQVSRRLYDAKIAELDEQAALAAAREEEIAARMEELSRQQAALAATLSGVNSSAGASVEAAVSPMREAALEVPAELEERRAAQESENALLRAALEATQSAGESARKVAALEEHDRQQAAELSEQAALAAAREEESARKVAALGMGVPDGVI